ncbi:MAG: DHH family phosphoesterase [Spirochaetales bacterium]
MNEPTPPSKLVESLFGASEVCICTHEEPDGDCVASSLALGSALERRGTRVNHCNVGPFDRREIKHFADEFKQEVPGHVQRNTTIPIVVLDCSSAARIGALKEQITDHRVLVIDHHYTGGTFGDERWVVPESPSTTYLVQLIMEAAGIPPTEDEANLLLFGFSTDTGFFRHLAPEQGFAFHGVARLSGYGASPKGAYARMFGGRTLESRRLIGTLLSRLSGYFDNRLLISWETAEDTNAVGKENRDSDAFYQLAFSIETCEALILLRQESPEKCTGSLRSYSRIDVSRVAEQFGGGGHKNAAGFLAEGTPDTLIPKLVEALAPQFE